MGKKLRHIHLMTDDNQFRRLKLDARRFDTTVNELIRRKLTLPPTPEELLLLRKLKKILNKK